MPIHLTKGALMWPSFITVTVSPSFKAGISVWAKQVCLPATFFIARPDWVMTPVIFFQMVMGLIQVESGFKKYAVSSAGARGYMQVMPFWVKHIGTPDQNLFHIRTNLRYGCTILRHYLDIEKGDLFRALGRYNGSLGRPEYPNMVIGAWRNGWAYPSKIGQAASTPAS